MIQLLNRTEIFKHNNMLSEIQSLQNSMYEDEDEYFETQEDKAAFLTQFDCRSLSSTKVDQFYKVITIHNTDLEMQAAKLCTYLLPLLQSLEVVELHIIAHLKMNLMGANLKHKYAPVKNASANLKKIVQTDHYQEAIKISIGELPQFIDIFFWLERCDASIPEFVFFHDSLDRFCFSLCKNGNVHFTEFEKENTTKDVLQKFSWSVVDGQCENLFTNTSKIEGRTTSKL
jgi:hypothetical protein